MRIPRASHIKKILIRSHQRGVVLMYHRVANLEHDPWCLAVSPAHFEEHMRVLKKYGKPLKMTEMSKNLNRFTFGREEIAITFDDGYADNFHNALPILKKYQIPATFYIVSGGVDAINEFWWDEIERVTLAPKALPKTFEMTIGGKFYHWLIALKENAKTSDHDYEKEDTPLNGTTLSKAQLHRVLWKILSHFSFIQKKETLRRIAVWSGCSTEARRDYLPMTTAELVSLANSPLVEIGAHTVCHPMLSRLTVDEQEREIVTSKHDLEKILNIKITSFSYPHGDHSDETVRLVRQTKFGNATTVVEGTVRRNTDPLRLPRFMVLNWPGPQFEHNLYQWITNHG